MYQRPHRKAEDPNMIYGTHPVLEALRARQEIDRIYLQHPFKSPVIREILQEAKTFGVPVNQVPVEKIQRMCRQNHQGVVAFLSPIRFADLDEILASTYEQGRDPFLLILDRLTDVRNFGAIVRSASCLGVDGIIISAKNAAPINGDAIKTSAGALLRMPIVRADSLIKIANHIKDSGVRLIGCTEKTDKFLHEDVPTGPSCVVMGSEENGISRELLQLCDQVVKIPMTGAIESFNVSVAAGIIMYEIHKERLIAHS